MKDFTQWPVIGRGNERVCYQNPDDPSRCVKVSRKEKSKQSQREIRYFQYLVKRQVAFTHIPRFYSVIQTDRYLGLEQERVLDSQGKQPPDLYHYLCQPLSNKQQREFWLAMDMLKDYLIRYNIIPCDLVMSNMLVVEGIDKTKVIMIDGFGGAEWIPIANYVRFLGKRKIERKWQKFVEDFITPCFKNNQIIK